MFIKFKFKYTTKHLMDINLTKLVVICVENNFNNHSKLNKEYTYFIFPSNIKR